MGYFNCSPFDDARHLLIDYFRKNVNITFVGNIKAIKKSLSFFFSRKKFLKLLIFKSMSLR